MNTVRVVSKIRNNLFFVFILLICITSFYKDKYKSVDDINHEALQIPAQTILTDTKPINFYKDGYQYTITPIANYILNGLVLHTREYDKWYSLSRTDKTFIKDICVVWGDTLQNKSHQSLGIKQDARWCWWNYYKPDLVVNPSEVSNNHLIASTPAIERQILSIGGGDQVRVIGKLVNVHATALSETKRYEDKIADWRTSTNRNDSGAGACEIIYVEKLEILKRAHPVARTLNLIGWYGLFAILFWSIVRFFISPKSTL